MAEKPFNALVGAMWLVSGFLMAWYPAPPHAPHDRSRAAALPYVGVVVIAAGIWFIVRAIRAARSERRSPRPAVGPAARHSAASDRFESLKLLGLCVVGVGAAAATLWWGIHAGLLSVVGLATSILGPALLVAVSRVGLTARAHRARR